MRLLYCHPTGETKPNDCIAFVDFELNSDVRVYGLRLMRHAGGTHLIFAPTAGKRRTATFSADMAQRLTALAVEAFEARVNA